MSHFLRLTENCEFRDDINLNKKKKKMKVPTREVDNRSKLSRNDEKLF